MYKKPFSRQQRLRNGKQKRRWHTQAAHWRGPKKHGNNPFVFANMKRGAKKQHVRRGVDTSLFVRKAIQKTEAVAFHPEHRFIDFPIADVLKRTIASRGYEHPTPIQDGIIPHILKGRDVIGIAHTGTGKTAAFLIPLIHKAILHQKERTIILVPTRELALQISEECRVFARGTGIFPVLAIGGMHIDRQARDLRKQPQFVIGTPGRIKDLISRKLLLLTAFKNVVLDEVDRMLDMGFVKDIRYLLSLLPESRQSLFFSATMPHEVRDLAMKFLTDPITISIASSRATSENVDQDIVEVKSKEEKIDILHDLLLKPDYKKTLIFTRTKHGASKLAHNLKERGFRSDAIHGDLSQGQRRRALDAFRDGRIAILVATDVAARGLDIVDVSHVINYDLPATYEDYIHRIGRTGRGHKTGAALTFIEMFAHSDKMSGNFKRK